MMATDLGEQFRAAMRRFPSTVSVISTAKDGRRHGMTATAVTSVSLNPPSLLVCVNRSGRLFGIMESCHRFCVNVLHAEHVAVSRNFAEPNCPDRFAYGEWHDNEHGIPYLLDAQVAMSCVKSLSVPLRFPHRVLRQR
jgi:flavin reductase (DIM6/NTAB) family NADH-FMN oxidoreductase RutF